jgi:hypothetical protein
MVGPVGSVRAQAPAPYSDVDFYKLAIWEYNPIEPWEVAPHVVPNGVPAWVKALDGKKVSITGLGLPLDYKDGLAAEFILAVSSDVCGFGATPRINEWISVSMAAGKKAQVNWGKEMVVKGTFKVKEEIEDGRLVGLYNIIGDSTINK